jgi:anti-sigma factor ChrR (cupin superfamily)
MIPGLAVSEEIERLAWRATSVPGVSWYPLHLDLPSRGEDGARDARRPGATVLIRMEPGTGYEPHRHVGSEDVLVLRGGYEDERGRYEQGAAVHYEPGSVHAPRALGDPHRPTGPSNPACILYAAVPSGIELLGERRG